MGDNICFSSYKIYPWVWIIIQKWVTVIQNMIKFSLNYGASTIHIWISMIYEFVCVNILYSLVVLYLFSEEENPVSMPAVHQKNAYIVNWLEEIK